MNVSNVSLSSIGSYTTNFNPRIDSVRNEFNSPSTVVSLGSSSPKIGTGVNAYRAISQMEPVQKSDIENTLMMLMMLTIMEFLL